MAPLLPAGKGPVTRQQLRERMLPRLEHDILLVTNAMPPTKPLRASITHEAVNLAAGLRIRGTIHVQNVDAYYSRLRAWLLHFRGVATRYPCNYLAWCWAINGRRICTPDTLLRAALGAFHI